MSALMMDLQKNALFEHGQKGLLEQVALLKQQLRKVEFENCCLHFKNKLSQMKDLNRELPQLLATFNRQISAEQNSANIPNFAIVLCYPFTQEFFIFHTNDGGLSPFNIGLIQQNLLPLSSHRDIERWSELVNIEQHIARLLLVGHDFLVWRVSLNVDLEHVFNQSNIDYLDKCISQGFQERDLLKRYIQEELQQERKAFSADLHDSIAQILGFLRIKSAQLSQQCKQSQWSELSEQVDEISSYTHYAYQQVRELITASRLAYQELDFIAALKKVIQEFEQQSSIVFELDHRVHQINIQPRHSVQVLYIIRESLSNIVRHSHASYAKVHLELETHDPKNEQYKVQDSQQDLRTTWPDQKQKLRIRITDNGQGIRRELKRKDSFGLEIMQERAERIGAILRIYALEPQGTCVDLTLTLASGE